MPLPRVRFTVRRMMVAVAVAALVIFGVQSVSRSFYYSQVARRCEAMERRSRRHADWAGYQAGGDFRRYAEWFALQRRAYDHAARFPFLPVAPVAPPAAPSIPGRGDAAQMLYDTALMLNRGS